ncbi:MAG: ABC transporter substrate-binding protein [Gemmatimonadota bacterium]
MTDRRRPDTGKAHSVGRRVAMTALAAAGLLLTGGCGGERAADTASDDAFCRDVQARVETFMEEAGREHPVPDDDRYGGTAVIGTIGELVDGMNGLVSADYAATQNQQFVNLMTLIQYNEALEPAPYLAESWEVNDSTTAITFHVRRDVFWHDGEPTTARDVEFTYLRATDPRTGFPNPAFWDHYVKGPEGVEVLDDYTVRVRLTPHAEFMDPWRTLSILPVHLLGEVAPEELKLHPYGSRCPVGNGPFVFVEHRPTDRWVFRANPAFPEGLGGRPFLDRYVYRIIPEQTTLLTELLTGAVDVFVTPRPDQAQRIIDAPNLELRRFPFRTYVFVAWNSRRPQLADARVRRAITMATDRRGIVDAILQGYGRVANSSVPPFHWAYDPSMGEVLPFDPDSASALLAAAGWTDGDGDGVRENAEGVPLAFTIKYNQGNRQRQDIAEIMQAQLRDVGIEATPQVVEWETLVSQITDAEKRDFDGLVMAWVTEFKLDDTDLFHSKRLDGLYAWSGTRNPVIDSLLDTLSLILDREEAKPLWARYQHVLAQEQPYTFFYYPDRLDGVNRRLQDVVMDARGEWINIKDWWIAPAQRR